MSHWYETVDKKLDTVVSARVRLARNVTGLPFPKRMSDEQKETFLSGMKERTNGVSLERVGRLQYIDMLTVPEEELVAMVERHTISPAFAKATGPRGLVLSEDETVSVMLLEEDHIRLQVLRGGAALSNAYEMAVEVEQCLTEGLCLAFDEQLGYLTACPTNLGTGLRASYMLHLPALESCGEISQLVDSVSKIGLTMRGMYGEGSRSHASLYQLSNQVTLGLSEQTAKENLTAITKQIEKKEQAARKALEPTALEDTVYRALGTLRYARRLSSGEMMDLLSSIKLGCSMGILREIPSALPMTLLVQGQPASLQKIFGRMTPADRDICRANFIRERMNMV